MKGLLSDSSLATRNLRRNTRRTFVALFNVSFGIVAFVLTGGFVAWIFQEIREATIHAQLGHIQIVRPGISRRVSPTPIASCCPKPHRKNS